MQWKKPESITDDIWISDGFDLHMPNRTGTYIINEDDIALVDTGPSLSVPRIKKSIEWLGRSLDDITYIIVTHVHLDHAGGAGLLLKDCPNAKVVVHPRGARHLIDPTRLVKGARGVYGSEFDALFDPVLPIHEDSILVKEHLETITLSSGRTLTFLDTPGHAKHHFSIIDSRSKGIFTGDTIGVQYVDAKSKGKEIYLPSTSPNQFNPDDMLASLELILSYNPSRIYFGHYGSSAQIKEIEKQVRYWLPIFVERGKDAQKNNQHSEELAERLTTEILNHYRFDHLEDDNQLKIFFEKDMSICAMGIIDFLQK